MKRRISTLYLSSLLISSCAFVPVIDKQQRYADKCDMYTKKMTLTTVPLDNVNCGHNDAQLCLLAWAVGAPAATLAVSGSVVIAGNTLHWVEYQGTCADGAVAEYVRLFKEKLNRT